MTILDDIRTLDGLITHNVGLLLYDHAQHLDPSTCIVEIGSYHGKSTCYLAAGVRKMREVDSSYSPQIHAVDPWETVDVATWCRWCSQPTFAMFTAQVEKMGLADDITAIMSQSVQAATTFGGPPIGLLYIDGNHGRQSVRADFTAWRRFLAPGAVVLFDDYGVTNNPGVATAVHEIAAGSAFSVEAGGRVARLVMP